MLSMVGIGASLIGVVGAIAAIVVGTQFTRNQLQPFSSATFYGIGATLFILIVPYLAMWILLKVKTNKQDILGIEQIGRVYSYVSGSLEILATLTGMILSIVYLDIDAKIISGALSWSFLVFMKIYAIRLDNNGFLIGICFVIRHIQFVEFIIIPIILVCISTGATQIIWIVAGVGGVAYFILDIGLTLILFSILEDRAYD